MEKAQPLRSGICGVCDTVKIIDKDKFNRMILTPDYAQIHLSLSNDTIATTSLCRFCLESITNERVQKLFDRIQATWLVEMESWASPEQIEKTRAITLKAWDRSEDIIRQRHEELKRKDFEKIIKISHLRKEKHGTQ